MSKTEHNSDATAPLIRAQARDARILPEWRNGSANLVLAISPLRALMWGFGLVLALFVIAVWVRHERFFAVTILAIGPAKCSTDSFEGSCETTLALGGIRSNSFPSEASSRYYLAWQGELVDVRSILIASEARSDGSPGIVAVTQHAVHLRLPTVASTGTLIESRPLFGWVATSSFTQADSVR